MTTTLNSFKTTTQLTAAEVTMFSTGATEKKFIGNVTVTNTSTSNQQVTIWHVGSSTTGTTGSGGNWIFRKTIAAGEAYKVQILSGKVLDNSEKISALAETASVVNFDASGTTET